MVNPEDALEELEVALLLEGVFRQYGYDFRGYSVGSITRRIRRCMETEGVSSPSALQHRVLREPECMRRFVSTLAIHVTAMFRDPEFYRTLRHHVVPLLRTYPYIRVWVAGCSSGEEVYSLAILLREEGIYDRCRIYATDLSDAVIARAETGIFPLASMQKYTRNYQAAGGREEFSSYYSAKYDNAILASSLRENITFAQHNLVSDASFNEFNLILCRNVMIYFSNALQQRVLSLFSESLCRLGILGLGERETLYGSVVDYQFEAISEGRSLYRRLG